LLPCVPVEALILLAETMDPTDYRSALKGAAAAAPPSPEKKATPKLGALSSKSSASLGGFRRGGEIGPGTANSLCPFFVKLFSRLFLCCWCSSAGGSRYTEDDVERNSSERVMAAQGISAESPGRPANTGMSHSDAHEFVNAGATDGIQIWRIEDLRPVPIPLPSYGKFHTGDSYILLHTKVQKNRKEFIIHFWLGSESTIDETG
jgi:hypothetical protein